MHLSFWGAAGEVTGSKHILEVGDKKILLDCGLHQGRREESDEKNRTLPFDAKSIDAVLLSHAHIDHCGLLPLLVKNGFTGSIFCTKVTADVLEPMLLDSAHIQEMEAKYWQKPRYKKCTTCPTTPIYTEEHARQTFE